MSYVWAERPKVSGVVARQMRLYRIFQGISPTWADVMARAFPVVEQSPAALEEKARII